MKYWERHNNAYELHFDPYKCNDKILLKFRKNEKDETLYWFSSEILNVYADCQCFDSIDEAKEEFEYMIKEHYQDQANHYNNLLEIFEKE